MTVVFIAYHEKIISQPTFENSVKRGFLDIGINCNTETNNLLFFKNWHL